MYEDHCPILRKNEIGAARQLPVVKTVAQFDRMKRAPERGLRASILLPDTGHDALPQPAVLRRE